MSYPWTDPDRLPGLPTEAEFLDLERGTVDGTREKPRPKKRSPSARAERSRTAARARMPRGSARRRAIKKILTEGLIPASPTK